MQDTVKRKIIDWALFVGFIIVFILMVPLIFLTAPKKGDVIVIDCTWSEISPDFTTQMREACRQARAKNFQNDLQKPK